MKTWQKIIGIAIISVLITAHIIILLEYVKLQEAAEIWSAEIEQESFFNIIDLNRSLFISSHLLSFVDCCAIIMLFIWLWRKGGKR